MNKVFGILAHVDAGKTTLAEQLLYQAGATRSPGRVDTGDTLLDTDEIERQRGITIFSGCASFSYRNDRYFLLDTPGHPDFSAEMERTLQVLDFAILVVSCVEGIQGQTELIWRLLRTHRIPVLLFLNKTDRIGADKHRVLTELRQKLTPDLVDLDDGFSPAVLEFLAERDDNFFERYLTENTTETDGIEVARRLFRNRACFPCLSGAALSGIGVPALLSTISQVTEGTANPSAPFGARVYKILHDGKGNRLTFLKITGGTLSAKDPVHGEKIHTLRIYQGEKHIPVEKAEAGMLCAVTGLSHTAPGDGLGAEPPGPSCTCTPALLSSVQYAPPATAQTVLRDFRILADEDPMLQVEWEHGEVRVHLMGGVQLEILPALFSSRFGYPISFGPCRIAYRETIKRTSIGYGHFEPLRHYAEVHLRLDPAPRGSGISFRSECPTDLLALNWQRLIETHVFEKVHKGVLTGAPLTDVCVTLLFGRAHLKHTEGGDFREAVYRAIRYALQTAENLLLEPTYRFSIDVPSEFVGRIISDIQVMHGNFTPPETTGMRVCLTGSAPVSEMLDYPKVFYSLTKGQGRLSLQSGDYAPCHNPEAVIAASGYDCERDTENTADSIFCSHGSGFTVKWQEAKAYMLQP